MSAFGTDEDNGEIKYQSQKVGLVPFHPLSQEEFERRPPPTPSSANHIYFVVVPAGCVSPNEFQNVKICISIW